MDEPLPRELLATIPSEKLKTQTRKLILRLARRPGALVTYGELYAAIWGAPPDGGPLDVKGIIKKNVCLARAAIAEFGWKIQVIHCRGYVLELAE